MTVWSVYLGVAKWTGIHTAHAAMLTIYLLTLFFIRIVAGYTRGMAFALATVVVVPVCLVSLPDEIAKHILVGMDPFVLALVWSFTGIQAYQAIHCFVNGIDRLDSKMDANPDTPDDSGVSE